MTDELTKAATNAAAMLGAVYEWVDRIDANGGAASLSGVATCHAFLISMKKNRARAETLVMEPLRKALKDAQDD
jgi:hypothetical protein